MSFMKDELQKGICQRDELQFVDTNVLVYAHDVSAGPKHDQAMGLLNKLWESQLGCLSVQVLQEFFVAVTARVRKPLSVDKTVQIIETYRAWRIHSPSSADVLKAIDAHRRYGISFWDAMIVVCARRLGCTVLWSEELNEGQTYEGVAVRNPFGARAI